MNKETIDEKVNCFECLGLFNDFSDNNCNIHTYHITGNKICVWKETVYNDMKKLRINDKHITLESQFKAYLLKNNRLQEYQKLLELIE